ncbi:MAG: H-NS family nucleoid-associated regulatory protein [Pseudomonadota bacterium]
MDNYLDLNRRFGLLTDYTADELFASEVLGKRMNWDNVLAGRFTVIVGRANFGKSTELKAKSNELRARGQSAIYVALHKVLGEDGVDDALETADCDALSSWKQSGGELTAFVDSLDEASLGTEDGIRKALRRLVRALDWPNSDVKWVFSSRPAVLTADILVLLQEELRTTLYSESRENLSDDDTVLADDDSVVYESGERRHDASEDDLSGAKDLTIGNVESTDGSGKTVRLPYAREQLKIYALRPLDKAAAVHYLGTHLGVAEPKQMLNAAFQFGLARLAEGPGGLDILAYVDPVRDPPQCLTHVFEKMTDAMQQQQRSDPREQRVGNPPPESLEEAIERLASASAVCHLTNIELSPKSLRFRDGVLSARPIIASLLSEPSLAYLLGSRLFIDSGQYQVKLYPDELLPFLAAKRLARLVKSPDHARRLLANFTWHSTTGECGVYRVLLPLSGWLAVFSAHCRKELITVEPQAVAFFGDLRNPQVQLAEASTALENSLERLVSSGDSLGRSYYTLTAENFWQAAKPGIAPTLERLFEKYSDNSHAKDVLLDIAGHGRLDMFRMRVLDSHGNDYSKLIDDQLDLDYIFSLGREDDFNELGRALIGKSDLVESRVARLVAELAWKVLDAKRIATIAAEQLRKGRDGYSIDYVLTHGVADEASDIDLYKLARSFLLRLVNSTFGKGRDSEQYWADQRFVELAMNLIALVITRSAAAPFRVAKLCLVLGRFVNKHHHGTADSVQLQAALQANKPVRMALLKGLVYPTDKTADGIYRGVFWYRPLYQYVDGDEAELGEPGFTELIKSRNNKTVGLTFKQTERHDRGLVVDRESKDALLNMLDGLRDASQENALVWVAQWLNRTHERSRYSECNFILFEQAAGDAIAQAAREGLRTLWRKKDPTWNEAEPNSIYNITIAGLQGLHLDLGDGTQLPPLSDDEVLRAIRYAQFEINGYPTWFWDLVGAHSRIAIKELEEILARSSKGPVSLDKAMTLIQRLDEAPIDIQHGLVRSIWNFIQSNLQISEYASEAALKVVVANSTIINQVIFESEAWRRMSAAFDNEIPLLDDVAGALDVEEQDARGRLEKQIQELRLQCSNAVVWACFWLRIYPDTFCQRLESWRTAIPQAAERLMEALAARLGEDRGVLLKQVAEKKAIGLNALKVLYKWAHLTIKEVNDVNRADGRVFRPGRRDHAQRFRDAIVPAISHAKSEHAYVVLEELRQQTIGPGAQYLRHVQFMMREEQYSKKPIAQKDYLEFERTFSPPVSDYLAFAMAVEADLLAVKCQIETGDFSLRRFFNLVNFNRIKTDNDGLALEEDFQAILGSELNHAAGGRYVVALEPILPEGTRRDVLCQTGILRATVELKMSVRWSLRQYIEALEKQLQGQYMMAPNSKIGFFVVVLQKQRTWNGSDDKPIGFEEVLGILRDRAREKEISDSSVYLRVIGIDASPKDDFRSAKKSSQVDASSRAPKYADDAGNTWGGRGRRPKWVREMLAIGRPLDDFLV